MNVLCVNDDYLSLMLITTLIKNSGFTNNVTTANNGQQALDYFLMLKETGQEDLFPKFIFLDIHMPVLDGWKFLDIFSKEYFPYHPTKIVITSNSIDPCEIEKAKDYPFVVGFNSFNLTTQYLGQLMVQA